MSKKPKKAKPAKPMDPAEAARLAYDKRQAQKNPGNWGANMAAMTLPQNREVNYTEATRDKVARLERYDCFSTLGVTVDQQRAVRRYEELMAIRYGAEGSNKGDEKVDGGSAAQPLSARRLEAAQTMEGLSKLTDRKWSLPLIERLTQPTIVEGRRANWKAIVRQDLGLLDRDAQARAVKLAAQDLVGAWTQHDNHPQKKAAA